MTTIENRPTSYNRKKGNRKSSFIDKKGNKVFAVIIARYAGRIVCKKPENEKPNMKDPKITNMSIEPPYPKFCIHIH